MRTAVLSLYHSNYQELADVVMPNWNCYCQAQGYHLKVFCGTFGTDSIGFQKMRYLYYEMFVKETIDVAWVIDLDVLITNQTIRIEQFLNGRDTYYLCLEPWAKINHGSFIVVKSPTSKRLIEFILSKTAEYGDEQTVLNCEFFDKKTWRQNFIGLLPHPAINSFLCEMYLSKDALIKDGKAVRWETEANWQRGHFALHLIALPQKVRVNIFKSRRILDNVIYVGPPAVAPLKTWDYHLKGPKDTPSLTS